jgi:hypothetical protein
MKLIKKRTVKKTTRPNCDQKTPGFSADSSIAAPRERFLTGDADISLRRKDGTFNPYNAPVPKPTANERSLDHRKESNAKGFAKGVDVRAPAGIVTDLFGLGDATFIRRTKTLRWFLSAY